MKSTRRKIKMKLLSKRTLALGVVVLMLAVGALGIFSTYGVNLLTLKKSDAEKIIDKAQAKLDSYNDVCLTFDVETNIIDEELNENFTQAQYVIASSKTDSEVSYIYRTADSILNQYWFYDEDKEKYKVYVYSTDHDKWVYTYLDSAPIATDTWNMLSNINTYTFNNEVLEWTDGTECYVFSKEYSTSDWQFILERIYISKETYDIKGIALYGTTGSGYNRTDSLEDYEFGLDGDMSVDSFEYELYNETVQRYSLEWSNESLVFFDLPTDENSMSDDLYMSLEYGDLWEEYKADPETFKETHKDLYESEE